MTVDLESLKAKAREFCWKITQSQYIVSRAHRLETVLINKQHQVAQPVMGRHKCTLPDRTFVQLTVANDSVNLLVRFLSVTVQGGESSGAVPLLTDL